MEPETPESRRVTRALHEAGALELEAGRDVVAALKLSMLGVAPETTDLGRYQRCRAIGRGGHGIVYEAFDPVLDRRVAIKVLLVSMRGSANMRERLRREAQAIAQLHHPNIVGVFDVGAGGSRRELPSASSPDTRTPPTPTYVGSVDPLAKDGRKTRPVIAPFSGIPGLSASYVCIR